MDEGELGDSHVMIDLECQNRIDCFVIDWVMVEDIFEI